MNTIKRLRKKSGLSQNKLAELLGITQSAVTKWETGSVKPRADKLPELAKIFGCSIGDLFDSEQEKSRPA